ncbi:DNA-dependent ATPase Mgs1p [[Candida] railenensis]|uniref:DNA-dependent ATPase Mgs1p n=1 Tax=[Candida] railenensis TaxID=45579 RepID=A0A9P0QTQ6_9ASCO|nr:DNA-dependent ATPase Mgs1p [[Candida] railenensis]
METCPLCLKSFPSDEIEQHANQCLDTQESSIVIEASQEGPSSSQSTQNIDDIEILSSKAPKNAFDILGLKRSSKVKTEPKRNSKNVKTTSSLTSILIAERKKKAEAAAAAASAVDMTQQIDDVGSRSIVKIEQSEPKAIPIPDKTVNANANANAGVKLANKNYNSDRSLAQLQRESKLPLAQRLRPQSLDEYFGQQKLVGANGILRNLIDSDNIPSFILWGVPGVGKTTLARIISKMTSGKFIEVSGVDGNVKRLREVFQLAENERKLTDRKTILFIDEIHRFNKGIQDILLPVLERGTVTIIGATTENPSFNLNNALLSRMHVFQMEPLSHDDMVKVISRGLRLVNKTRAVVFKLHLINLSKDAIDYMAKLSTGDSRVALNILESIHAYLSGIKYQYFNEFEPDKESGIKIPENVGVININEQNLKPLLSSKNYHSMFDKRGDSHYDTISAFHKSIRGSDPDAAIFYLVKMLEGGEDPLFIIRRLIVIASEDIGLRDSSCLPFAIAAKDALEFIGMPEGEIVLAHVTAKFARAPKSTKSYRALRNAQAVFKDNPDLKNISIPLHLRNAPTSLMKELGYGEDYKYNPNYENGKVFQSYLPKALVEKEQIDTKFLEKTHMGTAQDPKLTEEDYKAAESDERLYREYKEKRKLEIKNEQETKKRRSWKRGTDFGSNSKDVANINDSTLNDYLPERHSYDEFLPKSQQPPQFFDGEEKEHYSDDPDCIHNFENSYDENMGKDDQPRYEDEDILHYDPEYPIFYD